MGVWEDRREGESSVVRTKQFRGRLNGSEKPSSSNDVMPHHRPFWNLRNPAISEWRFSDAVLVSYVPTLYTSGKLRMRISSM